MIFLHRQNDLSNPNGVYDGIEFDVRSSLNGLILNHDRVDFSKKYVRVEDKLKSLNNKKVIANIKESGVEEELIELFEKESIDYYFLDSQIPDILRLSRERPDISERFIIRVSDVEPYSHEMMKRIKPKYVWLDYTKFSTYSEKEYVSFFQETVNNIPNVKFIVVSPELYSLDHLPSTESVANYLVTNYFEHDMISVCTKVPQLYKNRSSNV